MAQVNYSEGIQEVAPTATPPNDYQNIKADANSFGAAIGQGLEKFGAGATKAANFFGQAAADDASNQFQDFATKLLHGDPSKTSIGPDGQPVVDTGYMGTKGRATLDSRPNVQSAIDDKLTELRSTLTTPEQQLQFDNFSRKYRTGVIEKVGAHADSQANEWYQSVNTATSKLALDHIAINWDNPVEVRNGAADLTAAYVRNAQVKSGTADLDSVQLQEAAAAAKRDALTAQLNAMAVKDPSRALSVLDKNKEIAGIAYDNLAAQYRSRAKQQQGFDVGEQALRETYSKAPPTGYTNVALTEAGAPYGVSGTYLQRVHQLEGNGTSNRGAQGPFQFIPSTARQYGLKNPFDFQESAAAAARLAADNKAALTSSLGRAPTDAELYIAHQQGAGGAAALLSNPTMTAQQAMMTLPLYRNRPDAAADAIRNNGGNPDAPASAFTGMWAAKFNGAPGAMTATRKATAYQAIMSNPDLDPDVRQHALTYVNQQISAQSVAEEQDAKARKAQTDQVTSKFTARIIQGDTRNIINEIATSGLPGEDMRTLYNFATGAGGVDTTASFGPGYNEVFKSIIAPENDPSRIVSPIDIIKRGPGGTGELSKRGVAELLSNLEKIKKEPDQAGISTVKSHQLDFYKNKFGIDQSFIGPGVPPFKNPKGLDIFNHQFVPAFEAAYSEWIAAGKKPMDFLQDTKQMDAIMDRIYPPSERAKDSISADAGGGAGTAKPDTTLPPVPHDVEPAQWARMMKDPPKKADGTPWTRENWAGAINFLRDHPTPQNIKAFNDWFYLSGYSAQDVLRSLPVPKKSDNTAPVPGGVPVTGPDAAAGIGVRG